MGVTHVQSSLLEVVNGRQCQLWQMPILAENEQVMANRRSRIPAVDVADNRGKVMNHVLMHGAAWEEQDLRDAYVFALRTPSAKKKGQKRTGA